MSRSRRKTPIVAITTCRSERDDKKIWHQRWRSRERTALSNASPESLEAYLPAQENEIIDVWAMGKDGHRYWPAKDRAAAADHFANRVGRTQQECASLKQRLQRKWMSK